MESPILARPFAEADAVLRRAGLRPTRQRLWLAKLLFGAGERHVTAELLAAEAKRTGLSLAPATVYNVLNAFSAAGLVREVAVDGDRTWFDTHVAPHHHFVDSSGRLMDIPAGAIDVSGLPAPPDGQQIASIEVIVRLRASR